MPNCFGLRDRVTGQLALLAKVDDRMREAFGVKPHPTEWLYGWYDIIGFAFALGYDADRTELFINEEFDGARQAELLRALTFITDHYTVEAWATR